MKAPVIRFQGNLRVSWNAYRDANDQWIGVCEALALTVQGDTWEELCESISETLDLLMVTLLKSGELPAFLKERGWEPVTPVPAKGPVRFDIPFTVDPTVDSGRASQPAMH